MKHLNPITIALTCALFSLNSYAETTTSSNTPANASKVALGKLIFHDESLSEPAGQSCNSCHNSKNFYVDEGKMVSPGANPELFGNRNAPMIAYIKFNPDLYWDEKEEHWVGGFFLDGRAKTLNEQAGGPFLNPVEMGNSSEARVVNKVKQSDYAELMEATYGKDIWLDENKAFAAITDAIVSYEQGPEFGLFTSKYDYYLQGKVELTELEKKGLELFEAEDKANCAACHISQLGEDGKLPLLTDFTYDNLGLTRPEKLPFFAMPKEFNPAGKNYIDNGLAENTHINNGPDETGKFKVPTLRNIAVSGPYMHNGMFTELRDVVDFYNTRDVSPHKEEKWGEPEILQNLNTDELGDLQLTDEEIDAIVAFLETLTDGYQM